LINNYKKNGYRYSNKYINREETTLRKDNDLTQETVKKEINKDGVNNSAIETKTKLDMFSVFGKARDVSTLSMDI
jgi:hypothetical protein